MSQVLKFFVYSCVFANAIHAGPDRLEVMDQESNNAPSFSEDEIVKMFEKLSIEDSAFSSVIFVVNNTRIKERINKAETQFLETISNQYKKCFPKSVKNVCVKGHVNGRWV